MKTKIKLNALLNEVIDQYLNENQSSDTDTKLKCIQTTLKQELNKYNEEDIDDRWVVIRQYIRTIDDYFKDGYFIGNRTDFDKEMNKFLTGLNYSDSDSYKKGEETHVLADSNSGYDNKHKISVYRAIGNNTLFRGVSLNDWERIKSQGYIDSDMRGAILDTEGINLGQTPKTAFNYLPANSKGVVMAISANDLDLYMLRDGYIRVFEPIPIKNIIKVSDVFLKNNTGSYLTTDTDNKINDIVNKLKNVDIDINC